VKIKPINFSNFRFNFKWNVFVFPLILLLLLSLSYFAPTRTQQVKLTTSYPATVCPAIGNKISSIAALTNSKISRRLIDGKTKNLSSGKSSVVSLANNALLVEGNPGTALTFANSGWKSVVPCSVSNGEQWFVGGSGALTSKSVLYIVNSGFSESIVDIEIYTPNGLLEPKNIAIAQNSTKKISVDSLAPGDKTLTVNVLPRSGRINAFMIDEQGKGLRALGGDLINPINAPSRSLVIPAIPNQGKKPGQGAAAVGRAQRDEPAGRRQPALCRFRAG
jgi:hypothetical protein